MRPALLHLGRPDGPLGVLVEVCRELRGQAHRVGVVQEEWETGVSLLLPSPAQRGGAIEVVLTLEGKDALWSWGTGFHYPRSTTAWYPRSGYLNRSVFDVTYRHKKTTRIASVGQRMQEGPADAGGEDWTTRWVSTEPVALITFVCGLFQRHEDNAEVDGRQIPIEYYSPPGNIAQVKEDFILTEIGNAVRYFNNLFGRYPYGRLGAAYFPTNYGQGFPTLLLLPVHGYADRNEYAFMAHENAHQWWGNIVGWRSYRDQWLVEALANYSSLLLLESHDPARFTAIMQRFRDNLVARNKQEHEIVQAGPVGLQNPHSPEWKTHTWRITSLPR